MEQQQIRSFIAIELSDKVKSELLCLQESFKTANFSFVKWVAPEGIHLTLKFLGNVPGEKIPAIVAGMGKACSCVKPFRLKLSGIGVFPNLRRPSVLWVGVAGNVEAVCDLQKYIDEEFKPLGFIPEKRAFTPHLTLARLRETAALQDRKGFGELVSGTCFQSDRTIEVKSIALMRSQLTPSGAIYTRLDEVMFNAG